MKIGRNDLCPCRSGKKYKKCCLDKLQKIYHQETFVEEEHMKNAFFENYNSFDLLQSIAGLTLLPENHGKYVRMETLAQEIIESYNTKEEFASAEILKNFLDKEYPSNVLEDPPVNLFTDLISFYGGDYLIFPGITENGSLILTNQLISIFHDPENNIPEQFKSNCSHVASLILCISNTIAKKLAYTRYQDGTAEKEEIHFPTYERLNNLREAVTFSEDEMNRLLTENKIAPEALKKFLVDIHSADFSNPYIEESPLLYKPILHMDGKYLIVLPATLSLALTYFIWGAAESCGCMKVVNAAYQNTVWDMLQLQLKIINFDRIENEDIIGKTELNIREGLYQFDSDKIAYIQLIYDSGNNFNGTRCISLKENLKTSETVESHKDDVIKKIFLKPEYKNYQLLHFIIISSIGRDFYCPIKKTENARTIAMALSDFNVLYELKEKNAIDLWKFSIAIEEQLPKITTLNFSFLDQFKFYQDHNDSFYLSDETKYTMLHVQHGYSAAMIREAKWKTDRHSVLIETKNGVAAIPVERKDKYAPVYLNVNQIKSNKLQFIVEGFYQPILVTPKLMTIGKSGGLRGVFWELNDVIAYWLWQIQDECKEYLKPLGVLPLTVTFELNPIEQFDEIVRNFKRNENLFDVFRTSADKTSCNVVIPSEIIPYLYGSDNEGERVLVKILLLGLNKILAINNQPEISSERIIEIVNNKAPFGMKKKSYILDINDNLLLDPRNLVAIRYVQDYDVELVLNSIVPALGNPEVGEIKTKGEKEDFTLNIVMKVLLPNLKRAISQYNSRQLLEKLIGLNETLVYEREYLKILVPTRIACFVSMAQQEIDLKDSLSKINRTTIATRCLIEHVAAEQLNGNKQISTTAIDELLALMDQIISWASLCDQLKYGLFDIKIEILPSGRVGTEKRFIQEVFDPYYNSKIKEDVIDSIKSYGQVFPQRGPIKRKDTPDYLNKAFEADFGISFSRICEFVDGLALIGIQQPTPFAVLVKSILKSEINKVIKPFDEIEFENAINYLTLFERGKVEKIPSGYDSYDISPWRFNRKLSLLRKPLIAYNNSSDRNDPLIYWGFRHVLSIKIYLVEQIFSNRLKVAEDGEVIKALGRISNERGDSLVKKVSDKLRVKDFIVDTEVPINPNTEFYDQKDLGDIDVLVIDLVNKMFFSIECKSMSPSRNIKEMVEEVAKLFGSESEKGWIDKHLARDVWIKGNIPLIGKKYSVDLTGFTVKSLFVTREDMLTPYIKKQSLPIPFVTSYEIENDGINVLYNR